MRCRSGSDFMSPSYFALSSLLQTRPSSSNSLPQRLCTCCPCLDCSSSSMHLALSHLAPSVLIWVILKAESGQRLTLYWEGQAPAARVRERGVRMRRRDTRTRRHPNGDAVLQTPSSSLGPLRPHQKDYQKKKGKRGRKDRKKSFRTVHSRDGCKGDLPSGPFLSPVPRGQLLPGIMISLRSSCLPRPFGSSWGSEGPPHGVALHPRPHMAGRARESWWPQV